MILPCIASCHVHAALATVLPFWPWLPTSAVGLAAARPRRAAQDGNWSDVSGENFLRTLLTRPVEEISGSFSDEEPQFANASPVGGDPRQTAQRIMDLRWGWGAGVLGLGPRA